MRNKDEADSALPAAFEERGASAPEPRPRDSSPDYSAAVSPAQLAAGAAIIAGLIVLVARRRRRRTRT